MFDSRFIKLSLAFLFSLLLFACNNEVEVENFELAESKIDEKYGKDPFQKMDIYLPANRSIINTKVIILIHGGAWFQGDKSEMNDFIEKFQKGLKEKYAIVNMNYRLVDLIKPQYMLPTQTNDIESVIKFITANHKELGVNPEFVLAGYSAGAHLAMLYAYKFDIKNQVKLVVNVSGPSNLSDAYYTSIPLFALGFSYIIKPSDLPTNMSATKYASPITWVSTKSQPTISFYGTNDELVPFHQSTELESVLNQHQIIHETHVYEGGHDAAIIHIDDVTSKTLDFIDRYNYKEIDTYLKHLK